MHARVQIAGDEYEYGERDTFLEDLERRHRIKDRVKVWYVYLLYVYLRTLFVYVYSERDTFLKDFERRHRIKDRVKVCISAHIIYLCI